MISDAPRHSLHLGFRFVLDQFLAGFPIEFDDLRIAHARKGVRDVGDSGRRQPFAIGAERQAQESTNVRLESARRICAATAA